MRHPKKSPSLNSSHKNPKHSKLPPSSNKILFVTTTHPGWGHGHAQRVSILGKDLSNRHYQVEVIDVVLEAEHEPCPELLEHRSQTDSKVPSIKLGMVYHKIRSWREFEKWHQNHLSPSPYSLVIIDRREPPPILIETLSEMLRGRPIVAFDIRSRIPQSKKKSYRYQKAMEKITYVINAIPSLEEPWANLNGWDYLVFPQRESSTKNKILATQPRPTSPKRRLLLYLGSFSHPTYIDQVLTQVQNCLTVSKPSKKSGHQSSPEPMTITTIADRSCHSLLKSSFEKWGYSDLRHFHLQSFTPEGIDWEGVDMVVTHFGILGIEAIAKGIPTYFLNPTPYHGELAYRFFPEMVSPKNPLSAKTVVDAKKRLGSLGKGYSQLLTILKKLSLPASGMEGGGHSQASQFDPNGKSCDLCHNPVSIRHRRSWMNLVQCTHCKSYSLQSFLPLQSSHRERQLWGAPREDYGSEYFVSEYQRSYGRSYRDDEDSIKTLARERMKVIERLKKSQGEKIQSRLLDIGCAYGFFLDVASEYGYDTYGVDISRHAGRQVNSHHLALGDFREEATLRKWSGSDGGRLHFDIITLWYVIEHFPDVDVVAEKVAELQNPGGILAMSTPNAGGLSARYQTQEFLTSSPADHFHIFSLRGLKRMMSKFGYRYVGFRATGIHPQRFREFLPHLSWVPEALYRKWAAWTNLGDTMEVYFKKVTADRFGK